LLVTDLHYFTRTIYFLLRTVILSVRCTYWTRIIHVRPAVADSSDLAHIRSGNSK